MGLLAAPLVAPLPMLPHLLLLPFALQVSVGWLGGSARCPASSPLACVLACPDHRRTHPSRPPPNTHHTCDGTMCHLQRVRNTIHVCSRPMLSNSIWQQRISWTHAAADWVSPCWRHQPPPARPRTRPSSAPARLLLLLDGGPPRLLPLQGTQSPYTAVLLPQHKPAVPSFLCAAVDGAA